MISANLEVSNKEDWLIQFSVVDAETGDAIDFTGADIDFKLNDLSGCTVAEASTDDATITQPTTGTIEISVPVDTMTGICSGNYRAGCVYELNGATAQLFVANVSIYDGIAQV